MSGFINNARDLSHTKLVSKKWAITGFSLGIAVIIASTLYLLGIKGAILLLGAVIGIPLTYLLLINEAYLVPISVAYSIFLGPIIMGVRGVPIGLVMDAMLLVGVSGVILRALKNGEWSFFRIPGASIILCWIAYHLLQVGNPFAASRVAWFYVMRPAVAYPFLYFVAYHMLRTNKDVTLLWVTIVTGISVSIVWGLYQHIFGYFDFEMAYLAAADAIHLVYIQGRWRIFGTLLSPAQYGVVVTLFSMAFLILGVYLKGKSRYTYILLALLGFTAMVFSGTRTAYIVIPLSIGALVLVERSIKLYALSGLIGVLFLIVILTPTNNYHVKRIQSVFKTEEDASFQVREQNRKQIMPFIISHPIGGGLGSTGVWGMRFSPYTRLAQFAPDAGYMRVAVELGWLGLLLYLGLLVQLFWLVYRGFKKIQSLKYKALSLALISGLSTLFVIEFAQDIIGKLPMNILLWVLMALLMKLPVIDNATGSE